MKHPELFILPVLTLTDYFLTLAAEIQRSKKYADHFRIEHYELNPVWQTQVAQKKWFNPKHILLTVAIVVLLLPLLESGLMPESFVQGFLGCLLVCFGSVIGRHVCNLLTFRRIEQKPGEISGQVTMAHSLLLSLSMYQCALVLVPLVIVAVLSRTPVAIGGVFGVILLLAIHLQWIRKYNSQKRLLNKPAQPTAGSCS